MRVGRELVALEWREGIDGRIVHVRTMAPERMRGTLLHVARTEWDAREWCLALGYTVASDWQRVWCARHLTRREVDELALQG